MSRHGNDMLMTDTHDTIDISDYLSYDDKKAMNETITSYLTAKI